jgi:hypothetical protein
MNNKLHAEAKCLMLQTLGESYLDRDMLDSFGSSLSSSDQKTAWHLLSPFIGGDSADLDSEFSRFTSSREYTDKIKPKPALVAAAGDVLELLKYRASRVSRSKMAESQELFTAEVPVKVYGTEEDIFDSTATVKFAVNVDWSKRGIDNVWVSIFSISPFNIGDRRINIDPDHLQMNVVHGRGHYTVQEIELYLANGEVDYTKSSIEVLGDEKE